MLRAVRPSGTQTQKTQACGEGAAGKSHLGLMPRWRFSTCVPCQGCLLLPHHHTPLPGPGASETKARPATPHVLSAVTVPTKSGRK